MRGVGRGCSVGSGTPYRLQGLGIKSRYDANSFTPVQTGSVSHRNSCTMSTLSFSVTYLLRYGGNHTHHQVQRLKKTRTITLLTFVDRSNLNCTFQEGCVNSGCFKLFVLCIDIISAFIKYQFL